MKNIFQFRDQLVENYSAFSQGFNTIRENDIRKTVDQFLREKKKFCPEPLVQLNMNYQKGKSIEQLVKDGDLQPECEQLFTMGHPPKPMVLYQHQTEAINYARNKKNYVVTTGTGSGKSLTFIIPIIDRILKDRRTDPTRRTRAVIIYPMNALANSQLEEFQKFLSNARQLGIKVGRYTGQESNNERQDLADNPPDVLLTNYMMLEYLLTRSDEKTDRKIIANCRDLAFLVLDELHTYRGRQGADVALLVRRLRITTQSNDMICVGTSATMSSDSVGDKRRQAVADVAAKLFGAEFQVKHIIEETLIHVTSFRINNSELPRQLGDYLRNQPDFHDLSADNLLTNPLAIWVERNMGTTRDTRDELRRATPASISDNANKLMCGLREAGCDAGLDEASVSKILQTFLLRAASISIAGRTPFAFKLHQFISGPGQASVSLEPPGQRFITLEQQIYVPNDHVNSATSETQPAASNKARLFPVYFCRECGQAHLPAWYAPRTGIYTPRSIDEVSADDSSNDLLACILTPQDSGNPSDPHAFKPGDDETLPDNWLEENRKGQTVVKRDRRGHVPKPVQINMYGTTDGSQAPLHGFYQTPEKFPYCVHCGTGFSQQGKVLNRIYSLSIEGRSSASTVLTLSALNLMRQEIREAADEDTRKDLLNVYKILGFTDNRQDAALQAGFFNDFVHTALLRAALIRALNTNRNTSFDESDLLKALKQALGVDKIFKVPSSANDNDKYQVLNNPDLRGSALRNAEDAMDFYLGYSLIVEQRYGWRRNNPNLEQLGALTVDYEGIDALADDPDIAAETPIWGEITHASRLIVLRTLFNWLRQKLCLTSDYLDYEKQNTYRIRLSDILTPLWVLPESLKQSCYVQIRADSAKSSPKRSKDDTTIIVSPRSGIVKTMSKCLATAPDDDKEAWKKLLRPDYPALVQSIFSAARNLGIMEKYNDDFWQLDSRSLRWAPQEPSGNTNQNTYFLHLYKTMADLLGQEDHGLFGLEAQEHTAQVDSERRERLEKRFRNESNAGASGSPSLLPLPLLFCSPTMELGVDISSLDVVYMRNVPPTPANYAQRAGRAGRSGRAALAITYCAAASPHDQWFFGKPKQMVNGIVQPPAIDLSNQDMVESHIRAIWLHAAERKLDQAICNILDLADTAYPVRDEIRNALEGPALVERALPEAQALVQSLLSAPGLIPAGSEFDWIRDPDFPRLCLESAWERFDRAFDSWRDLYAATKKQLDESHTINSAPFGHSVEERTAAQRRYNDASAQKNLLVSDSVRMSSEFYSYRYLASQGFMPGYDFPRLPLLAWIPGKGNPGASNSREDGMRPLARPRFLALSEFGPMSLIYHQGATYQVYRVKLSAQSGQTGAVLPTSTMQICPKCGHAALIPPGAARLDVCEYCQEPLAGVDNVIDNLYKIETVETKRQDRITSTMEERQRQGFELQTCFSFASAPNSKPNSISRYVLNNGQRYDALGQFTYGPSATLWRVNKGWRHRADKSAFGFRINPITGHWTSKNTDSSPKKDNNEPVQCIVPYVEDRCRNVLVYNLPPGSFLRSQEAMATLQAALSVGIVRAFQIETSEIVIEPLPDRNQRNSLLIYEASEGGAGVLHQLLENPNRFAQVAREALQAMHYTQDDATGEWKDSPEDTQASDPCDRACYRCLLSYNNQMDHELINRRNADVLGFLQGFANGTYRISQGSQVDDAPESGIQAQLAALGLPPADVLNKELPCGVVAPAYYEAIGSAVFTGALPPQARELEEDFGCTCFALALPESLARLRQELANTHA